jgi:spermidine synthase
MGKKIGKANFWQRIGSYLSEITLERSGSLHNEHLEVILKNGRYQLCTENAIYSYDDRYDNFRSAFAKTHIGQRNIKDSLLLGLGLGSIPYLLEHTFDCHFPLTAVEIDEEVIYLAEKYVLKDLQLPIQSICTDALHFLQVDQNEYDLICMDVFKDDFIPEAFRQKEFLEDIQRRLRPDGIFLYNHLSVTDKDQQEAFLYFREVFQPFFPKGTYIDTRSNFIFLNDDRFLTPPE